jgi:hypothetical protein
MVSSSQHLYGSAPEAGLPEPRQSSRSSRNYKVSAVPCRFGGCLRVLRDVMGR